MSVSLIRSLSFRVSHLACPRVYELSLRPRDTTGVKEVQSPPVNILYQVSLNHSHELLPSRGLAVILQLDQKLLGSKNLRL